MSDEKTNRQFTLVKRPTTDDHEAWLIYWQAQGQSWRTESEIDIERQKYLSRCRATIPNVEQGIYPFRDIKLSRADIEWLLATHDNEHGPVDWSDENQRNREGLDIRGANLRNVDLQKLPLACIHGGLNRSEWMKATLEQRQWAVAHLENANLSLAHLENAHLVKAHLEGANLYKANLEKADLYRAHLEGAYLSYAQLAGASLRNVFFDISTSFSYVTFVNEKIDAPLLADVHWGDVNLSLVDWGQLKILGDENAAQGSIGVDGKPKQRDEQLWDYRAAVRANRQLAVILRNQGLSEEGDRFAYRAQVLQRVVLRLQGFKANANLWFRLQKLSLYAFSGFLDLLAGYGYHPVKTLIWYLTMICGFATAYYILGHLPPFPDALVFSIMSFHGRGFFPNLNGETNLHNPLVVLASVEAIFGLFLEVSFIATFTQRFFGK